MTMLVVASGAGCSSTADGDSSSVTPDSKPVSFESSDGVKLEGRLFPSLDGGIEGSEGVVLSHMLPADQRSWFPFAERLASEGYTALAFDLRGYCPGGSGGCSEGTKDVGAAWMDVAGAATFLRAQGVSGVSLVGASMGGTASLVAAGGADPPAGQVQVVITLSAPVSIDGLSATPELLLSIQAAKLFIAALGDGVAAEAAQLLYEQASSPKRVEVLPVDAHGTDLLTANRGEEVRRLILSTLDRYTAASPTP
jgi:pimeloyl-ACP methyl ester carboxylesterase